MGYLIHNLAAVFVALSVPAFTFLIACYADRERDETFGQWLAGWFR